MSIFKKKKNRVIFATLAFGAVISSTSGVLIYRSSSDIDLSRVIFSSSTNSELANNKNNINKAIDAIKDNNVVENEKPVVIKPAEVPKIKIPDVAKETNPSPEVNRNSIRPEKTEPLIAKPNVVTKEIFIHGVKVNATIEVTPDRVISDYDKDRKISNVNPYQNIIVSKVLNVEVTQELRDKSVKNALNGNDGTGLFAGTFFVFLNNIITSSKDLKTAEDAVMNNPWIYRDNIHRYERLLNNPNVVNFLKEDAKKEYPNKNFDSIVQRQIWLIHNLDQTKFTKLAKDAESFLSQGLVISPRAAIINEDGTISSHGFAPDDQFNTVTSRISRDNRERRVFGYDSPYGRSPDNVWEGSYPGWKKEDVTSDTKFQKYNVSSADGIKLTKLTREKPEKGSGALNEGLVVEIDASNTSGYDKTLKLINELKKDKVQVTSYRIKNMGNNDPSQKFRDILNALPDNIPQLELFFSAEATNTSSLIALENKRIKELSLYTLGNSLLHKWSFNPLALRNTEWINTVDYNVSRDFRPNTSIPTRITFDTIAFDSDDFKNKSFERINDGLRMVYFARNNEPFFQAGLGPGLNPDHNEGNNSYPMGLDFSRVEGIKSLRNLVFNDVVKSNNTPRKIRRLTLFNNSEAFEISSDELSNASFEHFATDSMDPYSKPKIMFSNGDTTNVIKISDSNELDQKAVWNLSKFFEYNEKLKASKRINVPKDALKLKEQLERLGYKVVNQDGNIIYT
ncbi:putative immunoglobulin-blocking virulence protein [Mycoplasmopsis bovis]|uniref:putative immunoglobulin-blocking virulence protein n=1 Tax=Mycoplasmopsis bovis TaxID=28903 RepID=UPI003BF64C89